MGEIVALGTKKSPLLPLLSRDIMKEKVGKIAMTPQWGPTVITKAPI